MPGEPVALTAQERQELADETYANLKGRIDRAKQQNDLISRLAEEADQDRCHLAKLLAEGGMQSGQATDQQIGLALNLLYEQSLINDWSTKVAFNEATQTVSPYAPHTRLSARYESALASDRKLRRALAKQADAEDRSRARKLWGLSGADLAALPHDAAGRRAVILPHLGTLNEFARTHSFTQPDGSLDLVAAYYGREDLAHLIEAELSSLLQEANHALLSPEQLNRVIEHELSFTAYQHEAVVHTTGIAGFGGSGANNAVGAMTGYFLGGPSIATVGGLTGTYTSPGPTARNISALAPTRTDYLKDNPAGAQRAVRPPKKEDELAAGRLRGFWVQPLGPLIGGAIGLAAALDKAKQNPGVQAAAKNFGLFNTFVGSWWGPTLASSFGWGGYGLMQALDTKLFNGHVKRLPPHLSAGSGFRYTPEGRARLANTVQQAATATPSGRGTRAYADLVWRLANPAERMRNAYAASDPNFTGAAQEQINKECLQRFQHGSLGAGAVGFAVAMGLTRGDMSISLPVGQGARTVYWSASATNGPGWVYTRAKALPTAVGQQLPAAAADTRISIGDATQFPGPLPAWQHVGGNVAYGTAMVLNSTLGAVPVVVNQGASVLGMIGGELVHGARRARKWASSWFGDAGPRQNAPFDDENPKSPHTPPTPPTDLYAPLNGLGEPTSSTSPTPVHTPVNGNGYEGSPTPLTPPTSPSVSRNASVQNLPTYYVPMAVTVESIASSSGATHTELVQAHASGQAGSPPHQAAGADLHKPGLAVY